MKRSLILGLCQGAGILGVIFLGILIAYATDILTVDRDGTIRLRVSDTGKVTLNTAEAAEGDLRFTPRAIDPTAPLAGDLWYNSAEKLVKYADGNMTTPLAETTNAALTLYVNGTTGDNNNSGLTSGTAVQTIQKAVDLVPPIVRHAVTINIAAGVYRDLGGASSNVYIADKSVLATGSITIVGDVATPSNVRVTGNASEVDPTPIRANGFFVYNVYGVSIRGILCNYFTLSGVRAYKANVDLTSCVCSNNSVYGMLYDLFSRGWLTSCTANSNGNAGLMINTMSSVNPTSCTFSSNTGSGVWCQFASQAYIQTCTITSNGSHGILGQYNANMNSVNNVAGANNTGYGVYANRGAQISISGTTPNGTSGGTGADAATFAICQ
ncbi:MAG: hypothetical protein A2Z34_12085 [Planctomycetes bacterium RBG_16_59_8]|nr:MAG: hypothetical protein A2Z34_12085 [Planctomycetes bacterium RBG_16_59_8]